MPPSPPVVKADAYGHGSTRVAAALVDVADAFCVATLDEALALRRQVASRVIALYPVPAGAAAEAVAADVELTVMSRADLEAIAAACASQDRSAAVHLCLETGHGSRRPHDIADRSRPRPSPSRDPRIVLAGLWSHLASPEDVSASRQQVTRFDEATAVLAQAGGIDPAAPPRRERQHLRRDSAGPGPRPAGPRRVRRARRRLPSRPAHGRGAAICGRP